ncbi:hypothetical protein X474_11195 [Dethiosulfatarculus sandiegensis]|uniref:Uncharacterized protein n=1 Tax=Dethiosulfatarculus sandiegensis TaxID=1429043 RepID=A0A0D2JW51_9BACT|nr:hypothetical protein X474_11195 [Dethiosulfatarculus sandiegensis]
MAFSRVVIVYERFNFISESAKRPALPQKLLPDPEIRQTRPLGSGG